MTIGRKIFWRLALVIGLGLAAAPGARAQCATSTVSPALFGTVTSFAVKSAQERTSIPSSGLACNGGTLVFLTTNTIDGTVTSANGGSLVGPTGDKIPYSVYADSGYSTQLTYGATNNWAAGQFMNFLGLLGSGSPPIPLYLQTGAGANVAAGTYTDTLTVHWSWNVCYLGAIICLGSSKGSASVTIPVTLTVTNDCTITAPNISFGSAAMVAQFRPVTGNIALVCTKGMTYTVGLGAGAQPAANGRRQMVSGSNYLQYDIYSAGGSIVWGDATNRVTSSGAATGVSTQNFPYTASVYTDQATPPVGTYLDTVVIDVRY